VNPDGSIGALLDGDLRAAPSRYVDAVPMIATISPVQNLRASRNRLRSTDARPRRNRG
jgi:hypothetical protein